MRQHALAHWGAPVLLNDSGHGYIGALGVLEAGNLSNNCSRCDDVASADNKYGSAGVSTLRLALGDSKPVTELTRWRLPKNACLKNATIPDQLVLAGDCSACPNATDPILLTRIVKANTDATVRCRIADVEESLSRSGIE